MARSLRLRRWAAGLCAAGLPLLAAGCADRSATLTERGLADVPYVASGTWSIPARNDAVRPAAYEPVVGEPGASAPGGAVQTLKPSPGADAPGSPGSPGSPGAGRPDAREPRSGLPAGRRTQRPDRLAREKVHESQIENDLAAKGWLPKVTAGVGYYRHEGGIQNEDGTLNALQLRRPLPRRRSAHGLRRARGDVRPHRRRAQAPGSSRAS